MSPILFTQTNRNPNTLLVGFFLYALPFLCLGLSLMSVKSEDGARSISKISGIAAIFGFLTLHDALGGAPDAFGALKVFIWGLIHNLVTLFMSLAVFAHSRR